MGCTYECVHRGPRLAVASMTERVHFLPGEIAALLLEWLASDDPDVTIAQYEDLVKRTREMLGETRHTA
jgi:hypothetical protein